VTYTWQTKTIFLTAAYAPLRPLRALRETFMALSFSRLFASFAGKFLIQVIRGLSSFSLLCACLKFLVLKSEI
jgi:ABC-type transport system involved in cytochrome c biogenesis permease subunit